MTRVLRRPRRLLGVLAAALAIIAGIGIIASVSTTQAAWTDRVYVSAKATAGTWTTPTTNSCTVVNADGTPTAGATCTVSKITYKPWDANDTRRDYQVFFTASSNQRIRFTVDLTTAVLAAGAPSSGSTWTWTNAGVLTVNAPQFTPTNGWTCGDLPIVKGQNLQWYTDAYFVVARDKTGQSVMCQ